MRTDDTKDIIMAGLLLASGLMILITIIWAAAALSSVYNVWSSSKHGEAELKKAEWTRQIAVKEAMAKRDSAIMLAQSEVERAKGVAEANKIIGESLKNNEAYLRYLWVDGLQHTKNQIVYIPTEASLPILEAGKR